MDERDLVLSCHLNVIPPLCYGNLPLSHLRNLRIGTIEMFKESNSAFSAHSIFLTAKTAVDQITFASNELMRRLRVTPLRIPETRGSDSHTRHIITSVCSPPYTSR